MMAYPNSDRGGSRPDDGYYVIPYADHNPGFDHYSAPVVDVSPLPDHLRIPVLFGRYWGLLVILIILGAAGGVASVVFDSPVYKARVMLEVQGINEAWLRNSIDSATSFDSNDVNIQTHIQLLRGGPFLRVVFERLQTESVPLAPVGTDIFSRLRQRFRPSTQDPMQYVKQGLEVALGSFDARPIARTRLIELICDSTSPEIASQFLNTIAAEFSEESLRSRLKNSQTTSEWLSSQIEETKVRLQESEERLQSFIQSSGNLFVSQETTLDDAKLAQLRGELTKIQSDRIAKQTRYELTLKTQTEMLPEVLDDAGLKAYQQRINEFLRERAALETTYTPNHPKMKKLDAQLQTLRTSLQNELNGVLSRVRNEYEAALGQERSLASAYSGQSQRVSAIAGKASQYHALKREVETLRQMYQSLLMQANQAGLASSVPVHPIRLVEASIPSRAPYKPRPVLNVSFGVVAGLALTVGIVFLREKLDSSVKGPGLTRSLMNAPELGVIPSAELDRSRNSTKGLLKRFRRKESESSALIPYEEMGESPSILAESFRGTLASLLGNHGYDELPRVILVTSSGPHEGKTLVTANLGIALAEAGRRVLLVDTDFRRPRLHQVFQVSNERSLVDLLNEQSPVADYTVEAFGLSTAIPGLTLLPNRPVRQQISKLLYSPRLPAIIDRLRDNFDMVIIDAPPVLDLADARVVARSADGVILVLRAGMTDRARALEAQQRIREDGLKLFGTVLNDWNPSKTHLKQHNYYYSYGPGERT